VALQVILAGGTIVICVLLCLQMLMRLDKEHGLEFSACTIRMLCLGGVVTAIIWYYTTEGMEMTERTVWLLIHIIFLSCSVTDHQTYMVYDVFQYLGIGLSSYLLLRNPYKLCIGISLILFALMQYLVFMKMYGKADGMVLLTAAVAEASLGYDIRMYLLHMIIAYLLLSVVQGIKGNIGRKGRLAKPVAFLPYIMIGFWVILVSGKHFSIYC